MTQVIQYITTNWVTWIFSVLTFFLGAKYKKLVKLQEGEKKKNEAVANGMQALLRDRIIQTYNYYHDKGYCPIYARENIKKLYKPYHELGGNDVATDLVDELFELPTDKKGGYSNEEKTNSSDYY